MPAPEVGLEPASVAGSKRAAEILANWKDYLPKFRKVMPVEYRRALRELKSRQAEEPKIALAVIVVVACSDTTSAPDVVAVSEAGAADTSVRVSTSRPFSATLTRF